MAAKSEQLQIRVTAREKAALKRLARAAGLDVSTFVLARVLPANSARVSGIIRALREDDDHRFALAELNDALSSLATGELAEAVEAIDVRELPPLLQNYVVPLEEPYFATSLRSLRLHLLRAAPLAYKRRNIFVDAGIGDRV